LKAREKHFPSHEERNIPLCIAPPGAMESNATEITARNCRGRGIFRGELPESAVWCMPVIAVQRTWTSQGSKEKDYI